MDPQPEISSNGIKDAKKSKETSTKKQNVFPTPLRSDKSTKNSRLTNGALEKSSKTPVPKTPSRGRGRPKGTTKAVLRARIEANTHSEKEESKKTKKKPKKGAESKKKAESKKDTASRKGAEPSKDKESVQEAVSRKETEPKKRNMKLPSLRRKSQPVVEHTVSQYPHGKVAALGHTDDFDVAAAPQWAGKESKRFVAVFAPHHSIFDEGLVVGKRRRTGAVDEKRERSDEVEKREQGNDGLQQRSKRRRANTESGVTLEENRARRGRSSVNEDAMQENAEDLNEQDPARLEELGNIVTLDRSDNLATMGSEGVNDGTVMSSPVQADDVPNRIPKQRVGRSVNDGQKRLQKATLTTKGPEDLRGANNDGQNGQKRLQKCRKTVLSGREDVNKADHVVRVQEQRNVATLKGAEEVVMRQPEVVKDDEEDPERSLDEICNFLADEFPTRYRRKKRTIEVMTID